jgi:hypothetical protein
MEPSWGASWAWGLSLITVTTAIHALGVVMIFRALQWSGQAARIQTRHIRHPIAVAVGLIAVVGLLLTILHGIEAGIWAAAYVWVGAISSHRDAMLYSVDTFTTRGASSLLLDSEWLLMGALEAADGMLLFGISTAFLFAVLHRVVALVERLEKPDP